MSTGYAMVFDADDTLWATNVLFRRVTSDFLAWLGESGSATAGARQVLAAVETKNIRERGYGSHVFAGSLVECAEKVRGRSMSARERSQIRQIAAVLTERTAVEPLPGVRETLSELAARHPLVLLTMGDEAEQRRKLRVSGLGGYFREAVVVFEKSREAYAALLDRLGVAPARSWMVGNSPHWDVTPALHVGMNAVHIPEEAAGGPGPAALEPAPDATGARILRLRTFAELLEHF